MANLVEILNTIRENASLEYQNRVPQATQTNLQTVGNPILNYSAVQNEFLDALIGRIGMTVVRAKLLTNPLAMFKKGNIPLGKDIQDILTNLASADAFDGTGSQLLTRKKPDTKVLYYRQNRRDQYTVTISREQLQNAFTSWTELENMLTSAITSLYSGDNYDEFILMKNLVATAVLAEKQAVKKVVVTDPTASETDAKTFVKAVRTVSKMMKFPSSNFNSYLANAPEGDTKPVITWTPQPDQVFIVRADVMASVDIDVLASAFNMDKATFIARTIEVDDFGTATDCYAVICDVAWLQVYDQLNEMTQFYNPQGLYTNYFWNHWQTYSISHFANAVAFINASPTELKLTAPDESVSNDVSIAVGKTYQIRAEILPTEATQTLTYTSSATGKATVSATGLITGVASGTATITVQSSVDTSLSKTIDVTVS